MKTKTSKKNKKNEVRYSPSISISLSNCDEEERGIKEDIINLFFKISNFIDYKTWRFRKWLAGKILGENIDDFYDF